MTGSLEEVRQVGYTILQEQTPSACIKLSILIPTYKRGKLLEESLYSILKQTRFVPQVEVIVLSNDSDDDMQEIRNNLKNYEFTIIRNNKNLGMCGNINKCALVGSGEYIAYLHDDDLVTKNYVEKMLGAIKSRPELDCIIPVRYVLNGNSEWGKAMQKKINFKHALSSCMFLKYVHLSKFYDFDIEDIYKSGRNCFNAPTCGTVFKRESLVEAGGFDSNWIWAFDLSFYSEFCKKYKVALYKEPLGVYRMVESASNEDKVQLEFFKAQKTVMDKNKDLYLVNKYYYEYLHLFYMGLSCGARKLIDQTFGEIMNKWSPIRYFILRVKTQFFYYTSGIEVERYGMGQWYKERD